MMFFVKTVKFVEYFTKYNIIIKNIDPNFSQYMLLEKIIFEIVDWTYYHIQKLIDPKYLYHVFREGSTIFY